ncbi:MULTISPECIES: CcoQ/FixQ family Cbb3-type cytochrome c oxidase assembly chaperone [Rhizobium]|uniref:CcoQ/FixQ family Cbb3-type cytochrome c oxidase assembly chaperone n=2 Tax=Rhizobium TaxID=379 RepID=A0A2A5KM47_9HYPH|nr:MULTISPECIES: CcoQ/FixQ family Cbb3-type cytochrome c oxidase assembly chaperone [Rhizobium]AIC29874.1 cbb3-type cytochrome-c oxidase subunit FixQ [Rhizobium sp. IE4771]PCK78146.1 CcoQ/FixQ family Cbb3-type cytochrome c oxidase assembly chaperone [Rhizobium sophoriradicis]
METYSAVRDFVDTWGLLAMAVFFVGAVSFTLRPGSKQIADDIAITALKDE